MQRGQVVNRKQHEKYHRIATKLGYSDEQEMWIDQYVNRRQSFLSIAKTIGQSQFTIRRRVILSGIKPRANNQRTDAKQAHRKISGKRCVCGNMVAAGFRFLCYDCWKNATVAMGDDEHTLHWHA